MVSVTASFSAGTLSPVRAASSALRLAHCKIRQSAGTLSPASSTTTSPTTSSWLFTIVTVPSRKTLQVDSVMDCNAFIACSALLSCTTPKIALSNTTTAIIIASAKDSFSFAGLALFIITVTRLTTAAANKMIIIGSASCFKNFTKTGVFLPSSSLFAPFACKRRWLSSAERPFSDELSCCKTSSVF
ncbi:putative uncharacterized protein [Corallococcus sp. CAG:1435]|nr:putative uncharacterized protein [Corallococcus sp. CAG:1435]